jgi:hypothetical protein
VKFDPRGFFYVFVDLAFLLVCWPRRRLGNCSPKHILNRHCTVQHSDSAVDSGICTRNGGINYAGTPYSADVPEANSYTIFPKTVTCPLGKTFTPLCPFHAITLAQHPSTVAYGIYAMDSQKVVIRRLISPIAV